MMLALLLRGWKGGCRRLVVVGGEGVGVVKVVVDSRWRGRVVAGLSG